MAVTSRSVPYRLALTHVHPLETQTRAENGKWMDRDRPTTTIFTFPKYLFPKFATRGEKKENPPCCTGYF